MKLEGQREHFRVVFSLSQVVFSLIQLCDNVQILMTAASFGVSLVDQDEKVGGQRERGWTWEQGLILNSLFAFQRSPAS